MHKRRSARTVTDADHGNRVRNSVTDILNRVADNSEAISYDPHRVIHAPIAINVTDQTEWTFDFSEIIAFVTRNDKRSRRFSHMGIETGVIIELV